MTVLELLLRSSEGNALWLLIAGPAGAILLYWRLYQYYRNTGQSHAFEHETLIESKPLSGTDQLVDEVRGTRRSEVEGRNEGNYRQRVRWI